MDLIRQDFLKHGNCRIASAGLRLAITEQSADEDVRKALLHYGIADTPSPAIVLWGTGEPCREFLYVDDLAKACVHLVKNYDCRALGEFINVGTGEDISIKDLALLVKEIVGFRGSVAFDHTKPDGMPKKLLDISRIRGLGWKPEVGLREGIQEAYQWYCTGYCT
jgi:GDP-L-fucose synthase